MSIVEVYERLMFPGQWFVLITTNRELLEPCHWSVAVSGHMAMQYPLIMVASINLKRFDRTCETSQRKRSKGYRTWANYWIMKLPYKWTLTWLLKLLVLLKDLRIVQFLTTSGIFNEDTCEQIQMSGSRPSFFTSFAGQNPNKLVYRVGSSGHDLIQEGTFTHGATVLV